MKPPAFSYYRPDSLDEALALLAEHGPDAKPLAGGQSLVPAMNFRLARPAVLIDLNRIASLAGIEPAPDGSIRIGAMTRQRAVERSATVAQHAPLLSRAVPWIAHPQIRTRGTIGGSLAHADPASELPCIAATCQAELRVLGPSGERQIAAADFFQGPLTTALAEDELILEVRLPAWPAGRKWAFSEFARRPGDFALAGVALFYDLDREARARNAHIGVLGACYFSSRLPGAEQALNGRRVDAQTAQAVGTAAATEADPTEDFHATAEYRKALVGTLLERAVVAAANRGT